jgi:hypothetical protein
MYSAKGEIQYRDAQRGRKNVNTYRKMKEEIALRMNIVYPRETDKLVISWMNYYLRKLNAINEQMNGVKRVVDRLLSSHSPGTDINDPDITHATLSNEDYWNLVTAVYPDQRLPRVHEKCVRYYADKDYKFVKMSPYNELPISFHDFPNQLLPVWGIILNYLTAIPLTEEQIKEKHLVTFYEFFLYLFPNCSSAYTKTILQ